MRRRGGVLVAACAVAVLGLLAGCSGSTVTGPSPTPLTSSSSSASPGPSVSVSASPTLDPNSDAAIIAAVEGWNAANSESAATLSSAPLRKWATPTCSCLAGADRANAALAAEGHHLNVVFVVQKATVTAKSSQSATVEAIVTNTSYSVLAVNGRVVQSVPAASISYTYIMKREGVAWLVDAVLSS